MKIPGTLYQTTHEQLDDVGCYCYTKPRFGKNGLIPGEDPYVPVGAIMMYIKTVFHRTLYVKTEFDVYLYKDKFVEFHPEDEVVVPLNLEEL